MEKSFSPTDELQHAIRVGDLQLAQRAIANGADLVSKLKDISYTPLGWATYGGHADIVEALVDAGAPVPVNALEVLGEMEITDFQIDPAELEPVYARVAEALITHGASPCVKAFNGKPLIETFPSEYYPNIHRVLSNALQRWNANS